MLGTQEHAETEEGKKLRGAGSPPGQRLRAQGRAEAAPGPSPGGPGPRLTGGTAEPPPPPAAGPSSPLAPHLPRGCPQRERSAPGAPYPVLGSAGGPAVSAERPVPGSPPRGSEVPPRSPAAAFNPPRARLRPPGPGRGAGPGLGPGHGGARPRGGARL